jgi:hypothetical protein
LKFAWPQLDGVLVFHFRLHPMKQQRRYYLFFGRRAESITNLIIARRNQANRHSKRVCAALTKNGATPENFTFD